MIRRARDSKTKQIKVTFTLPADEPFGPVSVVGDFNGWTPGANPLQRRAGGTRSASVLIGAGETVRFRYLGTDGVWFDDTDADTVDEQGSVLSV